MLLADGERCTPDGYIRGYLAHTIMRHLHSSSHSKLPSLTRHPVSVKQQDPLPTPFSYPPDILGNQSRPSLIVTDGEATTALYISDSRQKAKIDLLERHIVAVSGFIEVASSAALARRIPSAP